MRLYCLRHRTSIRHSLLIIAGATIVVLAIFGAYVLVSGYLDTEGRVHKAQQDTQDALDFVNGRKAEIERDGSYATVRTVKKELIKVKEL